MENDPIAIVGVSCRFAGAANPGALWRMIMQHRSGIAPLGEDIAPRDGAKNLFDRPYPANGGVLGELYSCVARDQEFAGEINPGENQDLYFAVQLAIDALRDAGMRIGPHERRRGAVRFGYAPPFSSSTVNWLEHTFFVDQTMDILKEFFRSAPEESLAAVRARLVDSLPAADARSFLSGSGNQIAARVAARGGFTGGATTLDGGALSGFAALRAAMDDLRSGRADVALAGALAPPINRPYLQGVSGHMDFSLGAELVPFSEEACGTLPGEGGAFFVLKREKDALAARDRIYALVRSVACGTLPLEETFAAAAERAGARIHEIDLVEADGSGVAESDRAEVEAVRRLWGDHAPGRPLVGVGSVKGNIGNCFRAAASAGLLKAAMALRRRVLPPQIPAARPIAALCGEDSPAYLLNEARPWITGDPSSPRRAAVIGADFPDRWGVAILEEEPEGADRR